MTGSYPHIIKATSDDWQILAEMRSKLWPQESPSEHLAEISDLMTHYDYHSWLAFFDGDGGLRPVGFLEASIRPYVNGCLNRPVAFIEGIWCDEDWRLKGLAGQMVAICTEWAKSKGITELASDAYLENKASHQAHESWGFHKTETVVYFRKKL